VTIDPRWGVPYYDASLETETYTLEGMSSPRSPTAALSSPGWPTGTYHARVEGSFRRIVRHGSHPNDYWWEATDKGGTRFIYGGDPVLDGPSSDAILADPGDPEHLPVDAP